MTAIKRCCALALAVLMILTALPVTAFAETAAHETNASLHETTLDGIANDITRQVLRSSQKDGERIQMENTAKLDDSDEVEIIVVVNDSVADPDSRAQVNALLRTQKSALSQIERALDTKLVLLSLDVIGHGLQGIEVVDVIDALDLGAVSGNVLGQQILVVDQAISLHGIRNTDGLIPILEGDILVDKLLVRLSIGHVFGVGRPVLVADRAVDLEQGRSLGLGDLKVCSYVPEAAVWTLTSTPVSLV